MQWEQLSFLNTDFPSQSQPFDLRTNLKSDPFPEHVDSAFPINHIQSVIKVQQPCARQQVLERILETISQHDLPGTQYVGHYMRHKYRRNCKANTLRLAATSLMQFLSFFRISGKKQIEKMSREDLEAGAFLVEGDRAIKQIIGTHPDEITEIIAIEKPSPAYHNYSIRYVTDSQFRSISQTKTPQGTIAVVRLPHNTFSDYLPETIGTKILLLEDIQDPGNIGTLIRTAAAFNFSGVILSNKCADPLSQKCIQSTAGAVLSVWIRKTAHCLEFVEKLKKKDIP